MLQKNCICCGKEINPSRIAQSLFKNAISGNVGISGLRVCDECSSILLSPNVSMTEKLQMFAMSNPPINLYEDEDCYYVGDAVGGKIKNKVVGRTGGYSGFSLRIAKGLNYRVGGVKGQPIRQDILEKSNVGRFIITDSRLILQVDRYGFELNCKDVQSIQTYEDALEIYVKGKQYLVFSNEINHIAIILKLISKASEEYRNRNKANQSNGATSDDVVRKLQELKKLLDDGIIDNDEFNQLKRKLIN